MAESHKDRSDSRLRTVCLLVLTFVAVGIALHLLRPVLVPFLLALFISYCMAAIIEVQVRHLRLPRLLALFTAATLALAVLALVVLLAAITVVEMSDQLQTYSTEVATMTDWVAQHVPLERLGIHPDAATGRVMALPEEAVTAAFSMALVEGTSLVSNGALVLVFVFLLLIGSHGTASGRGGFLGEVAGHVKRYILQMTMLSAVTGVLVGITLAALGVRFALVFGFLAFLLNFIPTIGSIVATLLPLPVVLLSPELSVPAQVMAIVLPAVIQTALGAFVQPKVLGRSFGLHPVSIVLALIFFGMIWGVAGAFLATPITAVLKIVLQRIPETRSLAALLAGTYSENPAQPEAVQSPG